MLEKGKISAFQLGIMMYPNVSATAFLSLPTITAQYTKNDLWMSYILAALMGLIPIYLATRLHELFPKMTFIQYIEHIIGKIPGKILGMVYVLYFVHVGGVASRQYAEFVTGSFLFKTPILIIISSIILLSAFAVRGGVELLARCAVILTPLFILPLFFLLLLIPELDVKNMFPIFSHGITPIVKGTFQVYAAVSDMFMMAFFLPYLADSEKGRKWGLISLCTIMLSITYIGLITLFLLGPDTSNKINPVLTLFRYISAGYFFENLEALLLAMWVLGNFVRISILYYAAVLSFGQCFQLSDYRPAVFPLGILIVVFSIWAVPNYSILGFMAKTLPPFYKPLLMTLIPLCLFIAAVLRKRKMIGGGEPSP